MTFSQLTKEEIMKTVHNLNDCCTDAFLYAVFKALGSFSIKNRELALCIVTENNQLLHLLQRLVKHKFGTDSLIQSENTNALRGTIIYSEVFDSYLCSYFGFTYKDKDGLLQISNATDKKFFDKPCCCKSMLQALLLASGSITVPTVSDDLKESCSTLRYHLEIVLTDDEFADVVADILSQQGFAFKKTKRKNNVVLYLKDSSAIADLLVYVNAYQAKLQLENIIIERSIRNNVNRQSNCIAANIDKVVETSQKQKQAIDMLQQSGKLALLPPQLQKIAELRSANPEASLQELATLSGLSKSGVRHRLDKLVELSKELYTNEEN